MPEFHPTEAQRDAIETRGGTVLVSAGAGSGKTKVLTERLMKYVLNKEDYRKCVDIDRFVIITFTQAAAGELKSRIAEELAEAAEQAKENPDPEYRRYIRRQQVLAGRAQIGTIHHFCLSILRENCHNPEISLPPEFKVISKERCQMMKEETLSDVLDIRYAHMEKYPGFESLVNSAGSGRNDAALTELVLQLYEKMQCHAFPEKWAEECIRDLYDERKTVGGTKWGEELLSRAESIAEYWSAEMDRLIAQASMQSRLQGKYLENLEKSAGGLRELVRCLKLGWEETVNCPDVIFDRLMPPKNPETQELISLLELIKARRDTCKSALKKIRSMINADSERYRKEMQRTAPEMNALLSLTLDFQSAFSKNKSRDGFADYSDLEHKTAKLLMNEEGKYTELAEKLSSRYAEIMVDEYQDVSRVQDAIFHAVSDGGKKLFLVGDVKQAIYRFRLADPEIFNEKYRKFSRSEKAMPGDPKKILLRENFRSRKEILDCANSVFSHCMSEELGDIDYNEDAALICGSGAYTGSVPSPELMILETGEKKARQAEAEYVAEKIREMVASGMPVTGKEGARPVEYGDIAILLRSANSVGGIYRKELIRCGIPVMTGQGGGFFETREISLLFSLLKILDNPQRDAELVSVMSSPVYRFTADELTEIIAGSKKHSIWDCVQEFSLRSCIRPALKGKIRRLLTDIGDFRSAAPDLAADQLIRMILIRTELPIIFSAMPDGKQRAANTERLILIGAEFEKEGSHGLHRFVQYLTRMNEKNEEIPAQSGQESSVSIMSIHKSKGLEFPVVFLCDTAHQFNQSDTKEAVTVHPVLGLGPNYTDNEKMIRYPTIAKKAISIRLTRETLSEEMRLLYVAMTRPKEYLFLTAGVKAPEKKIDSWKKKVYEGEGVIDAETLSDAKSYLDWIIAACIADGGASISIRTVSAVKEEQEDPIFCAPEAAIEIPEELPEEKITELEKKIEYVYPYEEAAELPSKVTATELKKFEKNEEPESDNHHHLYYRKPEFLCGDKPLSGAEKGIATHLMLQYMDFNCARDRESIERELDRLHRRGFLSERQAKAVNTEAIQQLFLSPLGVRLGHADALHREFRFSLLSDADDLFGTAKGEKVLLQGVVDCCMEENGELVIVDYKTDNIHSEEQLQERTSLYSSQVKAYASALGRIFEKPVKETVLYFLSMNRAISLSMNKDNKKG